LKHHLSRYRYTITTTTPVCLELLPLSSSSQSSADVRFSDHISSSRLIWSGLVRSLLLPFSRFYGCGPSTRFQLLLQLVLSILAMNATAVHSGPHQLPHRKPLPPAAVPARLHPPRFVPEQQQQQQPQPQQLQSLQMQQQQPPLTISTSSQHRSRLSTSSAYSNLTVGNTNNRGPSNTNPVSYQAYMNQHNTTTRRSLSNATTSTSSTGGAVPVRQNSGASSNLQRTTSSRSGTSAMSYVALMRRQKATVWCDRAQVSTIFVPEGYPSLTRK